MVPTVLQLTLHSALAPQGRYATMPIPGCIPLRILEFRGHEKTLLAPLITYLYILCKTQRGEQAFFPTQPYPAHGGLMYDRLKLVQAGSRRFLMPLSMKSYQCPSHSGQIYSDRRQTGFHWTK